MKNPLCSLCSNGVGFEPELSQRQVAEKYSVGKTTVHRHRKHLTSSADDDGMVLIGRTVRDPVTGSWTRYRKDTGVPAVSYEDLERLFTTDVVTPPVQGEPHTEVLALSDLQAGKAQERGGGTKETIERARQSIASFVQRVKDSKPEAVLLIDGGDPIENVFNTPAQLVTNDLDVPSQIRTARRLFAEAIRAVAPHTPAVVFASVPSNHGQFRTGFKSAGGTTDADFGLDINSALEEVFEGRPGFEHVSFVRPEPLDDTAVVETSGTKIAMNHGYHSKGSHKHGEWWAAQDHGRRAGWDADILLMSHYHTFSVYQSGNKRWIISASSADPGSEWFSKMTGESSRSGMTAFSISGGSWSNIAIL